MRSSSSKKPTNLSLDQALLKEARELGVNLSRAAEAGLQWEVANAKARQWKRENAQAIEGYNQYIAEHGLPLAKYRRF